LAGTPLLSKLRFDFNPLDVSPPKVEAVATLCDLMKHSETDPNTISILAPSLTDAQPVSERLRQLPEVARVTTLENFVPGDQNATLAIIHAARVLKPVLDPSHRPSPPSDAEDVEAIGRAAQTPSAANASGKGADDARHLALLIWKLAAAPPEVREAARPASRRRLIFCERAQFDQSIISFGSLNERVRVTKQLEPISVDVDAAIPIGLIVTELLTNAFKYAFPGRRCGEVRIGLASRSGNGEVTVMDDGVGLPVERDGSGFRIMQALVFQIEVLSS
jgi:hypothetical protein